MCLSTSKAIKAPRAEERRARDERVPLNRWVCSTGGPQQLCRPISPPPPPPPPRVALHPIRMKCKSPLPPSSNHVDTSHTSSQPSIYSAAFLFLLFLPDALSLRLPPRSFTSHHCSGGWRFSRLRSLKNLSALINTSAVTLGEISNSTTFIAASKQCSLRPVYVCVCMCSKCVCCRTCIYVTLLYN